MTTRANVDEAARDYVLQTAEDADVKFVRLWFPDILGNLKGFAINSSDLRDAIEEGVGFDGSGHRGVRPLRGKRHAGIPRSQHLRRAALAPAAERRGAHVLRHSRAQRRPVPRRFPGRSQAQPGTPGAPGLHLLRWHGTGVFLPQGFRDPGSPWIMAAISTSFPASQPAISGGIRCSTWPRWMCP